MGEEEGAVDRRKSAVGVALRAGLLKECPVHGGVYDSGRRDYQGALMLAAFLINQDHPLVAPFCGDRAHLGELLKTICGSYGTGCPLCTGPAVG